MGSSSSKAAKTAAGAARRQYPERVPPTSSPTNAPSARPPPGRQPNASGPTVHPQSTARGTRDEAINLDGQDPHYSASLRSLGAVTPINTLSPSSTYHPTSPSDSHSHSHSSTSTSSTPPSSTSTSNPYPIFPDPSRNPALQVLAARSQLAREAEQEFEEVGRRGRQGRRFLDVVTIRQVLMLRDEKGVGGPEIERRLGLGSGVVGRLGARGVMGDTGMGDEFGA